MSDEKNHGFYKPTGYTADERGRLRKDTGKTVIVQQAERIQELEAELKALRELVLSVADNDPDNTPMKYDILAAQELVDKYGITDSNE